MPLQNRVTPTGDIVAIAERGAFMGNRGILHDENQRLGKRRWALKAWLICRTEFRGRHRTVMTPRRYTELFFFDEAAAIAAGHRPCYECRNRRFKLWQSAWQDAAGLSEPPRAGAMDNRLHGERIDRRSRAQKRWSAPFGTLPDGAFVLHGDTPHLVLAGALLAWSWRGYGPAAALPPETDVTILTPPSSILALRGGYRPILHRSAGGLCEKADSDINLQA